MTIGTMASLRGLLAGCIGPHSSVRRMAVLSRTAPLVGAPVPTVTCPRRCFSPLVREVNPRGFVGDYRNLGHIGHPQTQAHVQHCLRRDCNTIFCGPAGSGKLTIMKAVAEKFRSLGKHVAVVSGDGLRVNRLDGILIHHFLGLRVNRDELPSQEQLEGTFERHVRLMEGPYDNMFPTLISADVLVMDAVHCIPPVILLTIDSVCRRLRGRPREPFGGLRVIASADFWRLEVNPSSDTGGSVFQLPQWDEFFPEQRLLETIHGQDPQLSEYVHKAHFGLLSPKDVEHLEELAGAGTSAVVGGLSVPRQPIASNFDNLLHFIPRFPKQPMVRLLPPRYRIIKRTEVGSFVFNSLLQNSMAQYFGLVGPLSVHIGSPVHLLFDGKETYGVPAGTPGEVLQVKEHEIVVSFPSVHRSVAIPRMHISVYMDRYPEVRYELQQFPLFPRVHLSPANTLRFGSCYNIAIDGLKLADTNDLGNLLAMMRSFHDFEMCNMKAFTRLDGMVHEPTRIYYNKIAGRPVSVNADQWCRNCKQHIQTAQFYRHWDECVRTARWCTVCDALIPLNRLEAHMEKHQVVLCMDCGGAVEWRHWEGHRLTCPAMMREISADNEFLPMRTRQLALELGLDKRDLHTMKKFSRGSLPKSREEVSSRS